MYVKMRICVYTMSCRTWRRECLRKTRGCRVLEKDSRLVLGIRISQELSSSNYGHQDSSRSGYQIAPRTPG